MQYLNDPKFTKAVSSVNSKTRQSAQFPLPKSIYSYYRHVMDPKTGAFHNTLVAKNGTDVELFKAKDNFSKASKHAKKLVKNRKNNPKSQIIRFRNTNSLSPALKNAPNRGNFPKKGTGMYNQLLSKIRNHNSSVRNANPDLKGLPRYLMLQYGPPPNPLPKIKKYMLYQIRPNSPTTMNYLPSLPENRVGATPKTRVLARGLI